MRADSYKYFTSGAWWAWAFLFPGAAIVLAVLGFSLLGDGLRGALDPRRAGAEAGGRFPKPVAVDRDAGARPGASRLWPACCSRWHDGPSWWRPGGTRRPSRSLPGKEVRDERQSVRRRRAPRAPVRQAGDPGHQSARRIDNAMIGRCPALIERSAGVADVRAAVRFARAHELIVSVRAGGHNASTPRRTSSA